jgi:ECF sigma factor
MELSHNHQRQGGLAMSFCNQGRFRQQVRFLQRQFLQGGDLPFTEVLTERSTWENRGHFFAAAAEAMRGIILNRARDKKRLKRGGDRQRVDLDQIVAALDNKRRATDRVG